MPEQFDAKAFWADKRKKKWVVALRKGSRRDEKHVSAETEQGAIDTAKRNSTIGNRAKAFARLATPEDLGIPELKRYTKQCVGDVI